MTVAESLNRALQRFRDDAPEEPMLRDAYQVELMRASREIAARFRDLVSITAAATWSPPTTADVTAWAANMARIRAGQRHLMEAFGGYIAAVPGIDWTLTHPVIQDLLDKLGARAEGTLRAGVREPVAHAIAQGWAEGMSVPQTAQKIQAAVENVAGWQAKMLARTDLIGLSNGAGHWAVDELNAGAERNGEKPPIQARRWLSAGDDRVRPTHVDANGQTVPAGQPFQVGGWSLRYPGDPNGPDAEVVNCRCTELFEEGTDGLVSAGAVQGSVWRRAARRRAAYDGGRGSMRRDDMTTMALDRLMPGRRTRTGDASFAADPTEVRDRWQSDIAFEGVSTGDGRFMVPGSLSWREPPLTLMAMIETASGHDGASVAGRMDTFEKRTQNMDGAKLPTGTAAIYSTGVFDSGEYGGDIERMVADEVLRGISVDLAINEWAFRDPDTGEIIDPETATDEQWDKAFLGDYEFAVLDGEVMAATVCPTPAFADARIAMLASAVAPLGRLVWEAGPGYAHDNDVSEGQLMTTLVASVSTLRQPAARDGLVAGGGLAPLRPVRDWFFRPEPDHETALTVLETGEVFGHIALWKSCHTGYVNGQWAQCITPPRSRSSYADFHLGAILTAEGDEIPVGKVTIGTGHAPLQGGRASARSHYDNTGAVGAFVRATDGKHGIWVCGATRNDMTDEQIRDLRANPPSGDWRDSEGHLELQAALAVPVPGFPVKRSELALSASADGQVRVVSLILAAGVTAGTDAPVVEQIDTVVLAAAIDGPDALDELIQDDGCGCDE